jgi:chromosome segregation ATPase
MDITNLETIIASLLTTISAIGGGVLLFRKKLSSTNLEVAKDNAQFSIMDRLEQQIQRYSEDKERFQAKYERVEEEKLKLSEQLYKLTSEVERLTRDLNTYKEITNNFIDKASNN